MPSNSILSLTTASISRFSLEKFAICKKGKLYYLYNNRKTNIYIYYNTNNNKQQKSYNTQYNRVVSILTQKMYIK